jgi:hypothetical protein
MQTKQLRPVNVQEFRSLQFSNSRLMLWLPIEENFFKRPRVSSPTTVTSSSDQSTQEWVTH